MCIARLGAYVTLRNPVGLYMDHIDLAGWEAKGRVDISEFVRIERGVPGMIERLVIEAPPGHELTLSDLTIAGEPLRFGGQVAECITVKLVGMANIPAAPIKNPAVPAKVRSAIDPAYPQTVDRAVPLNRPLQPGDREAFYLEGADPAAAKAASHKLAAAKARAGLPGRITHHHR